MELIYYNESFYDRLLELNEEIYARPDTADFFHYRFTENPYLEADPEIVLAVENGRILGQVMLMPARFYLNGICLKGVWGTDLIVRKEARGKGIGTKISEKMLARNDFFAFGLTPASYSISKTVGFHFIGDFQRFVLLNPVISLSLLIGMKGKYKEAIFPPQIEIFGDPLILQKTPPQWSKNYWNENLLECSRDKDFIAWRFFHKRYQYYFYAGTDDANPFYIAFRPLAWKNHLFLVLVDFRANLSDDNEIRKVIEAAKCIMKSGGFKGLIMGSSVQSLTQQLRKKCFIPVSRPSGIMTSIDAIDWDAVKSKQYVFVNMIDSDYDFVYQETGHFNRRIIKGMLARFTK